MYQNAIFGTFEKVFKRLRPAFSRKRAHRWFCTASRGLAVRDEGGGVASVVRALGLEGEACDCLPRVFRSGAVDPGGPARLWCICQH